MSTKRKPVGYLFDFEGDGGLYKDCFVLNGEIIEPLATNIRPLYKDPAPPKKRPRKRWSRLSPKTIAVLAEQHQLSTDGDLVGFVRVVEAKIIEKNWGRSKLPLTKV